MFVHFILSLRNLHLARFYMNLKLCRTLNFFRSKNTCLNQLISTKSFKYISIYSRKIFAIKISNLKILSPISFKQIYDTKASPFDPER